MNPTLLVAQHDVQRLMAPQDVLDTVQQVYEAHGRGAVVMPTKISLDMSASGEPNWSNAMPAYIPELGAAGIKWAGGYLYNPSRRHLDYVQATLILNDPITGLPLAIMDAGTLTTLRTGASAAVAAKWLAKPGSKRVVVFGAGAQGRSATIMLDRLGSSLEELVVIDPLIEKAGEFVDQLQSQVNLGLRAGLDAATEVAEADVIITVTTANEPLVMKDWVRPGSLVLTLGSYQELDPDLVLAADKLFVDDLGQCMSRGELVPLLQSGALLPDQIDAEIGQVIARKRPGRESLEEIIVADLIGLGSLDIACAQKIYERLKSDGEATTFSFS